jgi:hypothetical protein
MPAQTTIDSPGQIPLVLLVLAKPTLPRIANQLGIHGLFCELLEGSADLRIGCCLRQRLRIRSEPRVNEQQFTINCYGGSGDQELLDALLAAITSTSFPPGNGCN